MARQAIYPFGRVGSLANVYRFPRSGVARDIANTRIFEAGVSQISGAASVTFSVSGTLTGTGALSGSVSSSFALSGALGGSGALSGAAEVTFTASGTMIGAVGAISGASSVAFAASGTLGALVRISGAASFGFTTSGALRSAGVWALLPDGAAGSLTANPDTVGAWIIANENPSPWVGSPDDGSALSVFEQDAPPSNWAVGG